MSIENGKLISVTPDAARQIRDEGKKVIRVYVPFVLPHQIPACLKNGRMGLFTEMISSKTNIGPLGQVKKIA